MEIRTLKSHTRQKESGPSVKVLRRSGLMPAVVYGQGKAPLTLTIDMNELNNLLNHITSQSLIALEVEGDAALAKTVMIKELQRHPVSRRFIHADFYEVDMNKEIHVHVPVVVTGKSPGVEKGGTIQIIRRNLDVICLPGNIPESIIVDVTGLDFGDSIHVSQIVTGENVKLAWDPDEDVDYTVIAVAAPTIEKEPVAAEEAEGAEAEAAEGAKEKEEEGKGKEAE